MLILPTALSIQSIEHLSADAQLPSSARLQLPAKLLNGGSPGLQAAIIQLLTTWSNTHDEPILCLTEQQFKNGVLSNDVFRTAYGLNALLLASKVVSSSNQPVPQQVISEYVNAALDPMERQKYADTLRGPGALLECVTNGSNEFISPFYQFNRPGGLRPKSAFHQISEDLLASCNQTLARRIPKSAADSIGNLLYELLKNTDEHAREDIYGNEITPSVRGVLIRLADLGKPKIDESTTFGDAALATYFSLAMLKQGPARKEAKAAVDKSPFIELSVFDAGPGLAMRWANAKLGISSLDEISLEQELGWVTECFDLHKTTKTARESGRGLAEAVSTFLTLKAFVRLRTGRLCLVQNFLKDKPAATSSFSPNHWDIKNKLLPQVSGTCFTIIFPIFPGAI